MRIVINLNEWIKVKLTWYGESIYNNYYTQFSMKVPTLTKDEDGYVSFQLWQFIAIFGEYIYMGNQNVIEPLEIVKEIKE